jgi:hypothetical protein
MGFGLPRQEDRESVEDVLGSGGAGGTGRPRRRKNESKAKYSKRLKKWLADTGDPRSALGGKTLKNPWTSDPLVGEGFDPRNLPAVRRGEIFANPRGRSNVEVPSAGAPLYQEGMQWEPVNWTPDEIWEFQQVLIASGYASEGLNAKVWDEKSANAYQAALTAANTNGIPVEEVLRAGIESEELQGGEERGPLQISLSDPADLASSGRDVGQRELGRALSNEEIMQFTSERHAQERMTQTDEYNRGAGLVEGAAGEFGQLTESPDVAAETWMRQNRGGEVLATDAAERAAAFEDLLMNSRWRLGRG